jgi:hypothetical protein
VPESAGRRSTAATRPRTTWSWRSHAKGFQRLDDRTTAALDVEDPYAALCTFVPDLFVRLAEDRGLAEAQIRTDLDEFDLRIILCGPVHQLIALDQWDRRAWRRYAGMVLDALRPSRAPEVRSG